MTVHPGHVCRLSFRTSSYFSRLCIFLSDLANQSTERVLLLPRPLSCVGCFLSCCRLPSLSPICGGVERKALCWHNLSILLLKGLSFLRLFVRGRANANPHYQKFCARVSHVWGNRRPQPQRSAMPGPHPEGAALLITASPAPGKYEVQSRRSGRYELTEMTYTCGCRLQHCPYATKR